MIEDMNSRKLGTHTQKSHIDSCKRFAAFLKRCPDTATPRAVFAKERLSVAPVPSPFLVGL